MEMKSFYKSLKKNNSINIRWILFWFASVLSCVHSAINDETADMNRAIMIFSIILIFTSAVEYYKKYACLMGGRFDSEYPLLERNVRLTDIVQSHAFSVKNYYRILFKRMAIFQGISVVIQLAVFIVFKSPYSLVIIVVTILLPIIVGMVFRAYMAYSISHESGVGFKSILSGVNAILILASSIVLVIIGLFLVIGIGGFLIDGRIVNQNQGTMMKVFDMADKSIFAMVVIFAVFLVSCISNQGMNLGIFNLKRERLIMLALLIISFVIYFVTAINNWVIITDNDISIRKNGVENAYTYEDIEGMQVYAQTDDSLQIELTFSDGSSYPLIYGSSSETDEWTDRYYSDYHFALEMADRLSARGVHCTVSDGERLKSGVKSLDQTIVDACDSLIREYQ